jgi:uncharacterized membrane protein YoaK (UPF0700 family)
VTATLSVAAVQRRVTAVPTALPVSPAGALGAAVSGAQNGAVTQTVPLAWDTLPAASRALT